MSDFFFKTIKVLDWNCKSDFNYISLVDGLDEDLRGAIKWTECVVKKVFFGT